MNSDLETPLAHLTEAEEFEMARLGIVRTRIDSFRVGTYRYSNLKDAEAQARRQLRDGKHDAR